MEPEKNRALKKSSEIRSMFDKIAPTYDLLNRIISLGLDRKWRKKSVDLLSEKKGGIFLDIAAGSGDISLELLRLGPKSVVSTDFSMKMLSICKDKLSRHEKGHEALCAASDALELPFRSDSFDGTVVAFGIRNFADRLRSLKEMRRVLKEGGISVILELTRPVSPAASMLYSLHAGVILPMVGKLISKEGSAYRYLPRSIDDFPPESDFLNIMREAGFARVGACRLTFGAATIFTGRKLSRV